MKKAQRVHMPHAVMKLCPCKGCTEREVGCHSRCDPYKSWRANADETKAGMIKEALADNACNSFSIEGRDKAIRRNGRSYAKPTSQK